MLLLWWFSFVLYFSHHIYSLLQKASKLIGLMYCFKSLPLLSKHLVCFPKIFSLSYHETSLGTILFRQSHPIFINMLKNWKVNGSIQPITFQAKGFITLLLMLAPKQKVPEKYPIYDVNSPCTSLTGLTEVSPGFHFWRQIREYEEQEEDKKYR